MRQADKNVDTALQKAVSSINKKNRTCDISAISQYISKLPANKLSSGSKALPHVKGRSVRTVLGSIDLGRTFFFFFNFPSTCKSALAFAKVRQCNSDA